MGNYYEYGSTAKSAWNAAYYCHAGKRVAMYDGATLDWLLGEHLGSTTVTANSSGARTGEIRYKAYGPSRYTYGTTPTTYHFTGQREESTIGLYYYGARWYDPALGRFAQPDSIIPNGAYPQDFNRYAYTRNNPVKFIDSSGHWVESALDVAGIVWDIYDIKQQGLNWKTGGALALDVAFLILPVATGGGAIVRAVTKVDNLGDVKHTAEIVETAVKTVDKANDVADAGKTVNKIGGSRKALLSPKTEKHHIFPKALHEAFEAVGIKVNKYTVEIPKAVHTEIGRGGKGGPWYSAWADWLSTHGGATAEDMYKYAGELLYRFGIDGIPVKPY